MSKRAMASCTTSALIASVWARPWSTAITIDGVSTSVGAVFDLGRTCTLQQVLGAADAALYSAKRDGRNLVRFGPPGAPAPASFGSFFGAGLADRVLGLATAGLAGSARDAVAAAIAVAVIALFPALGRGGRRAGAADVLQFELIKIAHLESPVWCLAPAPRRGMNRL